MTSETKAWLVTGIFVLTGIFAFTFAESSSPFLVPHLVFFMTLTVNTFFSIQLFASIQSSDTPQLLLDVALFFVYLGLAFSIGDALRFAFFALAVFMFAVPKYIFMRGEVSHRRLLTRKIHIDLAGLTFCAVVLLGTLAGYELESAWILAVGFLLANIYLLFIRPMYRL